MRENIDSAYKHLTLCGIDEAGRGPWAGPVVAAAVIWPDQTLIPAELNDSKQLSELKREMLYEQIQRNSVFAIGIASVKEIDTLNILKATYLAMQRAYEGLNEKPDLTLVDGNRLPAIDAAMQAVVKGDSRSASIAAASILAKVTRDRMMCELDQQWHHYGFARHKGYGTRQHQDALQLHGPCPHHRTSFAPIRALLQAA